LENYILKVVVIHWGRRMQR